ncbi:alpha-1B-glycoprotein-like isoform X3 [Carcharodon carcharias]|uniref:alpha-1B-glycoprotein-like isoform X3 n=1 Tax=Carcharodon carcharias TaxID=13397 RepID=UPI001B7E032F|nr:alpha-1B-glycoprotein-like isoform X3 [Carcharodon carcharias]
MPACRFKSILQMVALSILLTNTSSADVDCDKNNPLPRPILSLDPPSSVILPGESISLVCHFPLTLCNVDFYRNHKEQLVYFNDASYIAKVKLEADMKWKGNNAYTCKYLRYFENNRTWACSPHSDPVELIVTDKLPKPTASIEPVSGVVTVGERVQINCSSSYPSPISHLYKKYGTKPVETRIVSDSERSVILAMKDLEPEDSGAYCCSFEKTEKGKVYESERSYFVEVNVTATLPKANISVHPPSGVVSRGSIIRITCTGSILNSGGCFRLYRDSEQKGELDMSCPQQSATFTITDTDTDGMWNYNCLYSRKVKGTFYHSPRSAAVQVTVKRSNLFLIHWCLAAVILFGTVILLGIECSHMKRKKDSDGRVTD